MGSRTAFCRSRRAWRTARSPRRVSAAPHDRVSECSLRCLPQSPFSSSAPRRSSSGSKARHRSAPAGQKPPASAEIRKAPVECGRSRTDGVESGRHGVVRLLHVAANSALGNCATRRALAEDRALESPAPPTERRRFRAIRAMRPRRADSAQARRRNRSQITS